MGIVAREGLYVLYVPGVTAVARRPVVYGRRVVGSLRLHSGVSVCGLDRGSSRLTTAASAPDQPRSARDHPRHNDQHATQRHTHYPRHRYVITLPSPLSPAHVTARRDVIR